MSRIHDNPLFPLLQDIVLDLNRSCRPKAVPYQLYIAPVDMFGIVQVYFYAKPAKKRPPALPHDLLLQLARTFAFASLEENCIFFDQTDLPDALEFFQKLHARILKRPVIPPKPL